METLRATGLASTTARIAPASRTTASWARRAP
jgi:hypothetical protein